MRLLVVSFELGLGFFCAFFFSFARERQRLCGCAQNLVPQNGCRSLRQSERLVNAHEI